MVQTVGDPQLGTSQCSEAGSESSVLTKQQMLLWDFSSVLGGCGGLCAHPGAGLLLGEGDAEACS